MFFLQILWNKVHRDRECFHNPCSAPKILFLSLPLSIELSFPMKHQPNKMSYPYGRHSLDSFSRLISFVYRYIT